LSQVNLITNGGFEQPTPLPHNWGEEFSAGSSGIPGWAVVSGSVDIQGASWFDPYQGAQSLDLDGSHPGSIEQSFATTVGTTYQLSFAYANNPDSRGTFNGPQTADVTVADSGGTTLLSSTVTHTGSTPKAMNYEIFTGTFVADTTTATLKFTSTDPSYSNNGIALDAVSVSLSSAQTLTALTASTASAPLGQSVSFTATVTDLVPGGATPNGGTVTFSGQNGVLDSETLVNGIASFTTSSLAVGANTITASYGGTANFAPSTTGTIVTAAGNGKAGYTGNNGPATEAELNFPVGTTFDSSGDLFIADTGNNVVREIVKATGDIITVAGNGKAGYSGDNKPATDAELSAPDGVAFDSAGNLFITDEGNNVIREVVQANRTIVTVAGNGTAGYGGDNRPATDAELNSPRGLAVDSAGDVFIADCLNSRIREVVKATGEIITVAGNGTVGYSGDGGPAADAVLHTPTSVAFDSAGDLYITDYARIREVPKATGDIITVAGNSTPGYSGDNGPATAADLSDNGVTVDPVGNLFIADGSDNVIREVVKATGDIITIAGDGIGGYSGDGGLATAAELYGPWRVGVDSVGDVFIGDGYNNVIREVTPAVTVTIDQPPNVQSLNINQSTTGTIPTPYATDEWTFSAAVNTQVQFELLSETTSEVSFSLTGPNGWTGFTALPGGSAPVDLPASGTYILTAQGTGAATGAFAFEIAQTTQTPLSLGIPFNGNFAGTGQSQLFALDVPAAAPLSLQLTDPTASDHVELYARFGAPPTRQVYDAGASGAGASPSLLIPSADAGTWYVLVYAEAVAANSGFSLLANSTPVLVTAVSPAQYGANSVATLTLTGAGFTNPTSVALVAAGNTTTYPASSVTFDTFTQLTATFNLSGVPQGLYSVQVTSTTGATDTLPSAFTVTAAGQADLKTRLILPGVIGRHISSTFYVQYSNTGTAAMPAPLLLLESSVADDVPLFTLNKALVVPGFWTSAFPQGYSSKVEILASGAVPGWLEPGESVTVPVYYAGMVEPWNFNETQFKFDIRIFTASDSDPVDWSSLQAALKPPGVSTYAWSTIYGVLSSQLGDTWGGYVQLLDNEATYLGQLGEDVTDVSSLWNFAVQQADNSLSPVGPDLVSATDDSVVIPGILSLSFSRGYAESIAGRDTIGPLGFGWSTPWQTTAITAADGTVTILGAGNEQRVFLPDSRAPGTYFSELGDTGTLTADGQGGHLLTEVNGIATDYNANGRLNYIQDTNGNRITAVYTGGRLTSLTASSGPSIQIAYNSAGLISTVTDSLGRATTYTYDPSNEYLIAVTGFNGQTTSYTYNTPALVAGSPLPNSYGALVAVAFPGGTHQYFTYDSEGRLASTSNDNGAQPQTYAYNFGEVSATDGTGDTSHLYFNERGLVVKSIDALGNVTLYRYDGRYNLTKVTNALGQSETLTYNAKGEVSSATDFLGNATRFTYGSPYNRLTSMTDANGNKTSYAYNAAGDPLSTTYANGTSQSSTYDPEGDATSFLNANGQPINYTYNAAGQVVTETFSDGSQYTYTYDTYGNMLKATDSTGTTNFTYDPTSELLTKVAYPNGLFLSFTYNTAGQRTSMVDQTGFTVNYSYDAAGRLARLTDGSGNSIVTYTYDANGRLSQKTNGNGTSATYIYDADGNILHLVNYAAGGTINSRFDYTYNALGQEITEATLDGTWTYRYDADGQLIHAVFASTNPNIPSQDLAYSYDAMGNRVSAIQNGVTTMYTTNNLNEYTSVGGVNDTYDADGNLTSDGTNTYAYNSLNQLISVIGPSGTTTYTYNALGQRVASTTGGQMTQYLIDPAGLGNMVGEYDSGNVLESRNVYGLALVASAQGSGSLNFFDFDAVSSTVGVTSSSGQSLDSYAYAPFGALISPASPAANPFQFAGGSGVQAEGSGLSFMRARYYSPGMGRFISNDPIGILGGENLYAYSANSPAQRIDPTGEFWEKIIGDVAGGNYGSAIAGTISQYYFGGDAQAGAELAIEALPVAIDVPLIPAAIQVAVGSNLAADDVGFYFGQLGRTEFAPQSAPYGPGLEPGPAQYLPPLPVGAVPYPDGSLSTFPAGPGTPEDPSPYPIPPRGAKGDGGSTGVGDARDPNAMIGPAGFGSSNYIALTDALFPYQIDFENDPTATAPAQNVTITDQLDPNLDWSTFQLTGAGWGDMVLSIPAGSQHYEATVPMTYNGESFDVLVEVGIHTDTGQVYATFTSINPTTELPPDVLAGFLPPEDGTGRGEGYISFTIQPQPTLTTGTQIRNVALVTFDANPPIATDQVSDSNPGLGVDPNKMALVTIDAGPPTSTVAALPATEATTSFPVSWSGQDDAGGSGIASYDVSVSDNGGPFTPFVSDSTATSATFTGQFGHTYAFYSVATDNVGNVQPMPTAAQATTYLASPPTSAVAPLPSKITNATPSITLSWTGTPGPGATSIASYTIFVSEDGGPFTRFLSDTTQTSTTFTGQFGHAYSFYSIATDNLGLVQSVPATAQATTYLAGLPSSAVNHLPATTTSTSFALIWSGTPGPGAGPIASYTIFVSEDGGPFTAFLTDTTATTATFTGQFGHTYAFSSVATDNAGNVQPTPSAAQATTYLAGLPTSTVNPLPATTTSTTFTVSWSGTPGRGATSIASYTIFVSEDGGPFTRFQTNTTATTMTFTGQLGHTYGFYSVATDNFGDSQPTPKAAQATTKLVLPPAPLVTMTKVADVLNKKHQVTQVLVSFSGAVNATEADHVGTYRLATQGKGGSYTAKSAQVITLKSAIYNAKTDTVALTPSKPFALSKPVQLLVYGTGHTALQDSHGRLIDGDHNGKAGGNAVAILSGGSVKIAAMPSGGTDRQTTNLVSTAVDALLERSALAGMTKTVGGHPYERNEKIAHGTPLTFATSRVKTIRSPY